MYRNQVFIALAGALLLNACASTRDETNAVRRASQYMPLAVGNEWVYDFGLENDKRTQTIRVTGTLEFAGQTWYVVRESFDGKELADTLHLRTEGSQVLLYHTRMGKIMKLIDFAQTEADSSSPEVSFVSTANHTQVVGDRIWENCVVTNSGYVDAEVATYAPDVGLVQSYWFRGRRELVRAKINGKVIE